MTTTLHVGRLSNTSTYSVAIWTKDYASTHSFALQRDEVEQLIAKLEHELRAHDDEIREAAAPKGA